MLDERGLQRTWPEIEVPEARGLFFIGYYARVSGQLRQIRFQVRKLARVAASRAAAAPEPPAAEAGASVIAG